MLKREKKKKKKKKKKRYAEKKKKKKKKLPVIIAEFTEILQGVKPPIWQATHNLKARCDETESVAGLPESSKPKYNR